MNVKTYMEVRRNNMDYCYISDTGRICADTKEINPTMYSLRKRIGNVFPNAKEAKEVLNKIKEVLECQQCVDSEGV